MLVIDSAERIEAGEFVTNCFKLCCRVTAKRPRARGGSSSSRRRRVGSKAKRRYSAGEAHLVEVETLRRCCEAGASAFAHLGLVDGAHDETIAALTNLRTLAWVIKAGAALRSNAGGLASHTAIADRLWKYWTKDRADVQALMMRLARRSIVRAQLRADRLGAGGHGDVCAAADELPLPERADQPHRVRARSRGGLGALPVLEADLD